MTHWRKTLLMAFVILAGFSILYAKFQSPWLVSPHRVNMYDFEALKSDPVFAGLSNDALLKKLHDTFFDGRRQDYGDMNHTYYFHGGDANPFEPITATGAENDGVWDAIKFLNVYGVGYCGWASAMMEGLCEGFGYEARRWAITGHSIAEVYYNSSWHYFDYNLGGWGADASGSVYSVDWIGNNASTYMALPNAQTSKNTVNYFFDQDPGIGTRIAGSLSSMYTYHDCFQQGHDMSFTLRQGESITRLWEIENQANVITGTSWTLWQANGKTAWGEGIMAYQPCLASPSTDYKDGVYEESGITQNENGLQAASGGYAIFAVRCPYLISRFLLSESHTGTASAAISTDLGNTWTNITAGEISQAKGKYDFLVKFTLGSGASLNMLKFETIFMYNPGTFPKLAAGANAIRLYKYDQTQELTYYGTPDFGATLEFNAPANGEFTAISANARYRRTVPASTGDVFDIKVGNSAGSLTQALTSEGDVLGFFNKINHGAQNMNLVKYALPAASNKACVQVNRLSGWGQKANTTVRCYYTVDNGGPAEQPDLKITYDYYTATSETLKTATISAADFGANAYASFTIDATGLTKNRWVKMEVASDLPPDSVVPDAITNLAVTAAGVHTVSLTWTATGDDGSTGTATSYDVRYSTSAITEGNWSSATQAGGEPAPGAPGSTETFTVQNLTGGAAYYFSVKVLDETNNASLISNVVSASTTTSVVDTIRTGVDTDLDPNNKTQNNGSCSYANIKPMNDIDEMEYLLKFNLSSIPSSVTIASASVSIYCFSPQSGAETDVFKILVDWQAGTSCDVDGEANFNNRLPSVVWGSSHGPLAGTDYAATSAGTQTLAAAGYFTWDITSFVQSWVNNPVQNFGMIFSGKEGLTWRNPQVQTFEGANKPYLAVEYSSASVDRNVLPGADLLSLSARPNPFNPSTEIMVQGCGANQNIIVEILSIDGKRVAMLSPNSGRSFSDTRSYFWDAGRSASGVYLVKIIAKDKSICKRIVLMK